MSNQDEVSLRTVQEGDIDVFLAAQADAEAARMAAFKTRDKTAHDAHWAMILQDDTVIVRTILFRGQVAGNVVSWLREDKRLVGYWIGKSFWGQGIATRALESFLIQVSDRPLYAYVAKHNVGSIRVLEKCAFTVAPDQPPPDEDDVEELLMVLVA